MVVAKVEHGELGRLQHALPEFRGIAGQRHQQRHLDRPIDGGERLKLFG